ncbi:MAG: PAS domain S-box protein [Blastomonas sp.]|nr:PAS domain S-box protein [Blastomonas sp.]
MASALGDMELQQRLAAFDLCSDIVIGLSPEGAIASLNAAGTKALGYSADEIAGRPIDSIIPGVSLEASPDPEAAADRLAHHASGSVISLHLRVSPIFGGDGRTSGYWLVARDVSRRLRMRNVQQPLIDCARLVGEPFLERTVEVLADALKVRWVLIGEIHPDRPDTVRTVRFWSDGALQPNIDYLLQGTPCAEVAQNHICYFRSGVCDLFPDDQMLVDLGVESYLGVPLHSSNGQLIGLLAVLHDSVMDEQLQPALTLELFAGRAAAEMERLNSSSNAERLGRIIEDAASEAFLFDADTLNFILVNRGARDNLGYSMEELRSLTPFDIKPLIGEAEFRALIAPLLASEQQVLAFETVHRRKDGSDYNVAVRLQLLVDQQQRVFYAAIEDVTERNRTLRELQSVTNRLNTVLGNTSMAVFLMDAAQRCIYMNDAAEHLTGFSFAEMDGRILHDMIHHSRPSGQPYPNHDCAIDRALREDNELQGEEVFVHKDGSFYPVFYSASPIRDHSGVAIGTVIEARNIADELEARMARENFNAELKAQVDKALAERDAAEAQLRHAQKMEAVGKLTGGVAHDFNNLLQIIGGSLELLGRDVAGNERARQRVDLALSGVARGTKLAQQLLAFSRKQPLAPKPVNLPRLLANLGDMLHRALGEQIALKTVAEAGLWDCFVDEGQLENAILNLAINARDAMPEGGLFTIELANVAVDDLFAGTYPDMAAGDYVTISITDTGSGMPPEVRERIFEPFFTTKEVGKGTGLGLSMVYGLIKQSGGHVTVYSEAGIGTTFRIYLPRSSTPDTDNEERRSDTISGGSETILVVEDDDDVRTTVTSLLNELGYTTLTARDAAAGLAIVESGTEIDMLFSDVVMPGPVQSHELAKRAVQLIPQLAVLFTSGYAEKGIVRGGTLEAGVRLLSKPYTREMLARKVREALDARSSA